ncbi:MAG: hypothetical protein UY49_C0025G0006 [Microgenomates group bacterium GW2011_GWC1_49_7]|nr:MAG: hypothetical protein UY49_C0025G0006 [Microgenomates group bacterium GW2011_GWC1_49_7]
MDDLETLKRADDKTHRFDFTGESDGRVNSLFHLCLVAVERLKEYGKIINDVDSDNKEAFFNVSGHIAVLRISNVGDLDKIESNGLFIQIHTGEKKGPKSIMDIQIPRHSGAVDQASAYKLHGFSQEAFNLLTKIVQEAHPIDKVRYQKFMSSKGC